MNESIRKHSHSKKRTHEPPPSHPTLQSRDDRRRLLERSGAWRSPVARLLWEQEVAGSNPVAPSVLWSANHLLKTAFCRSRPQPSVPPI